MINLYWQSNKDSIKGFRYLWLKKVTGFDSSVHCAKCLRGTYSKEFSPKIAVNTQMKLNYKEGDILYFCGVSAPYKWESNLHLVGVVKSGVKSVVSTYQGDLFTVEGFEQIVIEPSTAELRHPNLSQSFLTCRNFQFGSQHFEQKV